MSDDLFAKLIELFNQPGPVNWKLAGEISRHLAGEPEPIEPWLAEEYRDLTRLAQMKVAEATSLDLGNAIDAIPVDRAAWAASNLESFRYLVEPLAEKLSASGGGGPLEGMMVPLGPAILGAQMGIMIGFLSHRILGQFDIGLPPAEAGDLYLVVPNVEAFAAENHLDARQVRLWVALHEVIHQAQFARPWVRPAFVELIARYLDGLELDPTSLTEKLQSFSDPDQFESVLSDPAGLAGLITTPEQRPILEAIQAFMAVIEGYADYLMDRAAPKMLPDLDQMRNAMNRRRAEPSQGEQIINRMLGLELKQEQYQLGNEFCSEVARRWGTDALDRLWNDATAFPNLAELRDPVAWAARVLLPDL
ncbi:MAG: zinc-dependent metalloprotease [Acidimicrobiia bacterium]|nr:zinc-dependent metalloprotease [Acidimicrobiia bacterium]MDH3398361.1 zinc-dependent metalloprotease [Acidimicrobiia bacterium]